MLWLGFAVSLLAWCLLSLGMEKHYAQACAGRYDARRARVWRGLGWALHAAAFAGFAAWKGWEFGPIFWAVVLMLSALAWSLSLTLWPKASAKLVVAVLLSGVATALLLG
ncbi:DUF3325 domain-containing protein [Lysobacter sp. cf310]|uniref:DUF3325 domain-containing protein n=1 Tax=Lysobacter sp. cf310 TaxID=1761790 RepID=UPI0008E19141|nr:DUF3325 domain-containing protein [Lysobacter sp. cf310]SFK30739.1 Protein of unknown function [Lysobacter sp. cf310]